MVKKERNYDNNRVRINVSGAIYETVEKTLKRYPHSLLGDPIKRQKYYCTKQRTYYFNRHRGAFESILFYYQSGGRLVIPKDIPLRLFFKEVEFFALGDEALCLVSKGLFANKLKPSEENSVIANGATRHRIWQTFESPESSSVAKILSFFCITVIIMSIILSCLTTSAYFQKKSCIEMCVGNVTENTFCCNFANEPSQGIAIVDLICYCWFLIEYSCRLLTSPSKRRFFTSFLNVVDFLVILPFFITPFLHSQRFSSISTLLGLSKLLRLGRIIKLARYSRGLKALGSTLCASVREVKMMMSFLVMVVVISSSLVYVAEMKQEKVLIRTAADGFWWSLTTITTVGYGDYYPVTREGKLIGSLCTILGALAFSLPVIVFATNFRTCYKSEESISAEYHRNLKRQVYSRW